MKFRIQHCCKSIKHYLSNGEVGLAFLPKFREYGLTVRDGGSSIIVIEFCPWCGSKLPRSLRKEWFERIDELGIDEAKDTIPTELQSEEWYSKSAGKRQKAKKTIKHPSKKAKKAASRRVPKSRS